jgi:hypothetical protein
MRQQLLECRDASVVVGPIKARSVVFEDGSMLVFAEAGFSGRNWIEYQGLIARTNRFDRTHQLRA